MRRCVMFLCRHDSLYTKQPTLRWSRHTVARQKRLTLDGKSYHVDLVFYNYILRCFVLCDLKTDELTHADLGQMQMYVNYYERELMNPGDNPPIGIVLCTDKGADLVRYTLPMHNKRIFAA